LTNLSFVAPVAIVHKLPGELRWCIGLSRLRGPYTRFGKRCCLFSLEQLSDGPSILSLGIGVDLVLSCSSASVEDRGLAGRSGALDSASSDIKEPSVYFRRGS